MQWKNPDGSITAGVVIEDGAGNKLTSFSGGSGSSNNFAPNGDTAQLAVSTTSARVALPVGATVMVYNTGSNPAFVAFGSNTVTATPANDEIPAGGALPFTPGSNTFLAAVTASGATSLNLTGGANLAFPLSGVGSGGGGSNASVGATGASAPTSATEIAFIDGGNLRAASKTSPLPETLTDPSTGNQAAVLAFHNSDNQTLSGTSYGLNTGGVAQLVNAGGALDRQRETSFDGVSAVGVAAGAQQLAGPPLSTTVTSGAITGSTSPQNVTLAAVSFNNRGVVSTLQIGSVLLVDTGASQEQVVLTSVNSATKVVRGVFNNSHPANVAVFGFAYNQARDATIPDGSSPAGIAASAAYFYNASAQTVEVERSAAGEQDGATGVGTAVAAEYEWNGGGPLTTAGAISGLAFDRARNLQGKGAGGTNLNGAIAAGATSITLTAVTGLTAGQQIRLDAGLAAEESAYVSQSYTSGSLTVALQSGLANAHSNGAAVAWDVFASIGPGLNGFTPAGIGIEEEALYDPVSAKYYIERAATQDACAPQNVVLEAPGLWNGSTLDRAREVIGDAQGATGIPAEALMLWNGASYDRAYGDKTNGLFVNVKQLPTGSNTIGVVVVANNPVGAAALATAQASIGTTAASIVPARSGGSGTGRIAATLYNTGAVTVFVGNSGVTTSAGIPVPAGASLTLKTTAALYGITASSTATVGVVETFLCASFNPASLLFSSPAPPPRAPTCCSCRRCRRPTLSSGTRQDPTATRRRRARKSSCSGCSGAAAAAAAAVR